MTIWQHRAVWTGIPGGTGISTFYTTVGAFQADVDFIRAFFAGVAGSLAAGVSVQVLAEGVTINEVSGAVTGTWGPFTAPGAVVGTGGVNFAAPVGAYVQWRTGGVVHNRRVRGRTFLVPLGAGLYDAQGTIVNTNLSGIQTAAAALVTNLTDMGIWSRPFAGSPGNPARSGSVHTVTSALAVDKAVVLRSRRD